MSEKLIIEELIEDKEWEEPDEKVFPWDDDKEVPVYLVLGKTWGGYTEKDYDLEGLPYGELIKWDDNVRRILSKIKFGSGYGAPECPAVIVWTYRYVYAIEEYDGSTGWFQIPRVPVTMEPGTFGG